MDGLGVLAYLTFLILALVNVGDACSCDPVEPKEQFCKDDFVILARITREEVIGGKKAYYVQMQKQFKMAAEAKKAFKFGRLLSAPQEKKCRRTLQMGKVYVISGKVVDNQAKMELCGYVKKLEDVTESESDAMKAMNC